VTAAAWRRGLASGVGALGRHYGLPGHRAFSLAARSLRRFPPPGELVYRDVDGYTRTADLRDHMESLVFVGRHRLPGAVMDGLRPGDWAIDIGANVGSVAGQLCRAVGPAGLVWAVEPLPRNVDRLRLLVETNGLQQLDVLPYALGSERGTATIRLSGDGSSGCSSFTASWISDGSLDVRTERLDDLTADVDGGRQLRLVKLDVEGFELEVLEGAEATLRRWRPLVYCEFNDIILTDAGSSSEELLGAFRDLGYSVAPAWRRTSRRLAGRNTDLLMTPAPE
jgi:FkbM family methyltransferase